ncbi:MAG: UDP-N-acetylglucosamine 1-carboxyvinyltransferase [bacterium]|nr:UDP-N-acetylglucosamine 1-carboxyvinyltransferase [bacterium]
MPKLTIEGGHTLSGTVTASGSKNAALPILASCILLDGQSTITNIPYLKDIVIMLRVLNILGLRAEYHNNNTVKVWNQKKIKHIAPYDLVTSMRASFFVAGPIMAKTGYAKIPLPGGCCIGSRPIDLHLKGFKALGASINIEHGFVELKAAKLVGTRIYLDFPSVGATENIMMAACLAEGETIIENAAQEPEITDLANALIKGGAKIKGSGTSIITVYGVRSLKGIEYSVIPDRVEAGTLLIAGAITKGDVTVEKVNNNHLEPLNQKLIEAGLEIKQGINSTRVIYKGVLNAVNIETLPFPGFPTDMQAQIMALLCTAKGTSVIKETIFENRFMHAHELKRMGAVIKTENHHAFVYETEHLSGAEVKITDLRAGAALILAGLVARGHTTVYGLKHLNRGYDNLPQKLRSLGGILFV